MRASLAISAVLALLAAALVLLARVIMGYVLAFTRYRPSGGAAVAFEDARGGTSLVASGDRDTFQLVSERTMVLQPQRGGGALARIGPAEVRERYGVEPEQVPDCIALRGDPSDKIPGARGVGAKTAAGLLKEYGSLEAALAEGRFAADDFLPA
mgnify:CR=1 FL=1